MHKWWLVSIGLAVGITACISTQARAEPTAARRAALESIGLLARQICDDPGKKVNHKTPSRALVGKACQAAGEQYLYGAGAVKDPGRSLEYLERSCFWFDHAAGCMRIVLTLDAQGRQADPRYARAACTSVDLGVASNGPVCALALINTGKRDLARKVLDRTCAKGDANSCKFASRL